jgi:hypothetical protein
MPVLTSFKVPGDPDELLKIKQEKLDPVSMENGPPAGALAHIVVKTDDGLVMFNLWESEEAGNALAEKMLPVIAENGLERTDYQVQEVVQHVIP